jgi:tetratricopeptide (TPR) repeat protein
MKLLREGKSFSGHERNCAFLNCGDGRFANISAVSGFDFDDDARAVANTDWDQDGDVDLWVTNRTGPRLRFLRNGLDASAGNHVSFKLVGTKSNADAIGSRVEVVIAGAPPLIATLHAGDAYLSQSSKRLHFGLGDHDQIEHVMVRWPSGLVERFFDVYPGQAFLLVEGSGIARPVPKRLSPPAWVGREQPPAPRMQAARTVLASRPPMPVLRFRPVNDPGETTITLGDSPVLLILWASWCKACRAELQMLSSHAGELEKWRLNTIALSVDELDSKGATSPGFQNRIDGLGVAIRPGFATVKLIDKLQVVQRIVLNRQPTFAVPVSYLIDQRGDLAVLYRGPIDFATLRRDIESLDVSSQQRRDMAVPFRGIWTTPPRNLLLRPVAQLFKEHGYVEDYDRIVKLELARLAEARAKTAPDESRAFDRQFAIECFNLARSLQSQGQIAESVEYYRQGLATWDESAEAHYYLARALQQTGERISAIEHYRRAIELQPNHSAAHFELGPLLAVSGEFNQASDVLLRGIELDPENHLARIKLGQIYASAGDSGRAEEQFRTAARIRPDSAEAHSALGRLLLATRRHGEAAAALESALQLNPRDADSILRLAWLRATSWDEQARNGPRALALARQLLDAANTDDPLILDVVAAAYAEAGDFDSAVKTARRALEVIEADQPRLRHKIEQRLRLYLQSQPFRDRPGNRQ